MREGVAIDLQPPHVQFLIAIRFCFRSHLLTLKYCEVVSSYLYPQIGTASTSKSRISFSGGSMCQPFFLEVGRFRLWLDFKELRSGQNFLVVYKPYFVQVKGRSLCLPVHVFFLLSALGTWIGISDTLGVFHHLFKLWWRTIEVSQKEDQDNTVAAYIAHATGWTSLAWINSISDHPQ